jgi:hypothetical protein
MNNTPTTQQSAIKESTSETIDAQRRNLYKLALWTPPVMLTLMLSKRASAVSNEQSVPSKPPTWGGY